MNFYDIGIDVLIGIACISILVFLGYLILKGGLLLVLLSSAISFMIIKKTDG